MVKSCSSVCMYVCILRFLAGIVCAVLASALRPVDLCVCVWGGGGESPGPAPHFVLAPPSTKDMHFYGEDPEKYGSLVTQDFFCV